MNYKENDFAQNEGQAEKISEELERESRRYSHGFSEEEAHRYIQKRSMDNGTGLVEVSQMILSLMQEG